MFLKFYEILIFNVFLQTVNTFKKPFEEVDNLLKDQYNDWLIPPRSWGDRRPGDNSDSLKVCICFTSHLYNPMSVIKTLLKNL